MALRTNERAFDSLDGPCAAPFRGVRAVARLRRARTAACSSVFDRASAALLGIIADLGDWHQLDHHTAATIVLDERRTPVALMLQQHNDVRTYLHGAGWKLPPDHHTLVDVAIRSNELYPHAPERRQRLAVRILTPEAMRYLLGIHLFSSAAKNPSDFFSAIQLFT